jgi:hypothetical protein
MGSGVLVMTASEVSWLATCSSIPPQRCNGQRRASHDRVRGVIVSDVLVMTAFDV